MTNFIIPCLIGFILVFGLIKKVDVFDEFLVGAKEGLSTSVKILPALIALMTCVGMFKVSGGIEFITSAFRPLAELVKMPLEVIPLALLRPISGSGALAIYKDIISTNGPDSLVGKIASVMMGSTETTFYTIAVYYGATKIRNTRHTATCSVVGDLVGFIMSGLLVHILLV